jgi:N-acetylneuraminic acid mutarotase
MNDPKQERLKGLLLELAGDHFERPEPDVEWDRVFENLVHTRFDAADVKVTEAIEAETLTRLHRALQERKQSKPKLNLNGEPPAGLLRQPLRHKLLRPALAFGLLLAVFFITWQAWLRPITLGRVILVKGSPRSAQIGSESADAIHVNMPVGLGTSIQTRAGERLAIEFNDGTRLDVEPGTRIEFPDRRGFSLDYTRMRPVVIRLQAGRIEANVRHLASLPNLLVQTPAGTAEALGTVFGVEVKDARGSNAAEAVLTVVAGQVRFYNEHGSIEVTSRSQCSARAGSAPTLQRPRRNYSFTSADGLLYAVGGASHGTTSSVAAFESYDPFTDTWTGLPSLPVASQQLAAVAINGIIYVVGGCTAVRPLDALQAYDPAKKEWAQKSPMPIPRTGISATVVGNKLYVLGGSQGFGGPHYRELVQEYDPGTDSWSTKAPPPTPRLGMGVGELNGLLYTVGGSALAKNALHGAKTEGAVEAYDPLTDTWKSCASLPTPREWPCVGVLDGVLYAAGGYVDGQWIKTVEAYDPRTDRWTKLPSMPVAFETSNGGGAAIQNGRLYILGRVPDLEPNHDDAEKSNRVFQGNIGVATMAERSWSYSDGDGLTNADERTLYGTDPTNPDTDGDGICDGIELWFGTNPARADSDGDGVTDWEDPKPLVPGAPGSRIVDALRGLSNRVRKLPIERFLIDSIGEPLARGRRKVLADGLAETANLVATGDRKGAKKWLWFQVRPDGDGNQPMDWMANGEEKAAIATEIQALSALLGPR